MFDIQLKMKLASINSEKYVKQLEILNQKCTYFDRSLARWCKKKEASVTLSMNVRICNDMYTRKITKKCATSHCEPATMKFQYLLYRHGTVKRPSDAPLPKTSQR